MVGKFWSSFLRDDRGHGLAEYCMVIAFVALASLGLYLYVSGGVQDLWSTANSTLVTGNSSTSGGGSTGAASSASAH